MLNKEGGSRTALSLALADLSWARARINSNSGGEV
jgi:hypothetical protein